MKSPASRVELVYADLERRIRQLSAGAPLPTMPQLRKELAVSQVTLERAYEALEARGLIERRKRKGVFVADRLRTGEFAVVVRPVLLGAGSSPYYRIASAALIRLLQHENPRWRIRMHVGRQTLTPENFPATLDLLDPSVLPRLRGVFSFHRLFELESALHEARVPLVYMGEVRGNYSVGMDAHEGFFRPALQHLRDVGCRTVGMIALCRPVSAAYARRFIKQAADAGLKSRMSWVQQTEDSTERGGYEAFLRFWADANRPDALVLQDDVLCNGVLRGTLQLGLRLPRDLKLISYANREVELAYHLAVTRVEYGIHEQARRAVEIMLALVRGKTPPRRSVLIPGELIKGQTT